MEFQTQLSTMSDKLYRIALAILQDAEDAKDVFQELQIRLWNKKENFAAADNSNAFIIHKMRNLCIDTIRRRHTWSL